MRDFDLAIDIAHELIRGLDALDNNIPLPRDPQEASFGINTTTKSMRYLERLAIEEGKSPAEQIRLARMAATATQVVAVEHSLREIFEPMGKDRIQPTRASVMGTLTHPPRAPALQRAG